MAERSYSTSFARFLLGVPFGFMAELFARLAITISGNQLDVDFNYLAKNDFPWEKPF